MTLERKLGLMSTRPGPAVWQAGRPALDRCRHAWAQRALGWQRRCQASRTARALQALDAQTLRDLAIDRSDISSLARHPGDDSRARGAAAP